MEVLDWKLMETEYGAKLLGDDLGADKDSAPVGLITCYT